MTLDNNRPLFRARLQDGLRLEPEPTSHSIDGIQLLSSVLPLLLSEMRFNISFILRNRALIAAVMETIRQWETLVAEMEDGPTKECHEQLIRLAKGQVKAWRFWLVSITIEQEQKARSADAATLTDNQSEVTSDG